MKVWLKLVFGLIVFVYLFFQGKIDFSFLLDAHCWPHLLVLIAGQVVIFVVSTYRWFLFTKAVDVGASFRDCLLHSWVGQFFASFLPSFVSADGARFFYFAQKGLNKKRLLSSLVFDRLSTVIVVSVLSLSAWSCFTYGYHIWMYLGLIVGSLLAIAVALPRLSRRFVTKYQLQLPASLWAVSFSISLVSFHLKVMSLLYVSWSLLQIGLDKEWFLLSMAGQFFEALPLSPANVGFGHYVFQWLYQFTSSVEGAQIYNAYFVAKLIFKLSGLIAWVKVRPTAKQI